MLCLPFPRYKSVSAENHKWEEKKKKKKHQDEDGDHALNRSFDEDTREYLEKTRATNQLQRLFRAMEIVESTGRRPPPLKTFDPCTAGRALESQTHTHTHALTLTHTHHTPHGWHIYCLAMSFIISSDAAARSLETETYFVLNPLGDTCCGGCCGVRKRGSRFCVQLMLSLFPCHRL